MTCSNRAGTRSDDRHFQKLNDHWMCCGFWRCVSTVRFVDGHCHYCKNHSREADREKLSCGWSPKELVLRERLSDMFSLTLARVRWKHPLRILAETVDLVNVVDSSFQTHHPWPNSHISPRSPTPCSSSAMEVHSPRMESPSSKSLATLTPRALAHQKWFNLKLPFLRSVRMCVVLMSILGFCDWLLAQIHWKDQNRSNVNPYGFSIDILRLRRLIRSSLHLLQRK